MDVGYCIYYVLMMVVFFCFEGVFVWFVIGYMFGEQVGDDCYVVCGFDFYVWVEVYFEDIGWVCFDLMFVGF